MSIIYCKTKKMLKSKIIIISLLGLLFISACNRKTHQQTTATGQENPDFTPKSGTVLAYPALKNYPDLKANKEGRMLTTKELANKICFCSYDLTRINEDIKRYHRNNDKRSLERIKTKVDAAYSKFDRCMAEVKAYYPKAVMENNPDAVMEEVKRQCPGLVELMDAGHKRIKRKNRK